MAKTNMNPIRIAAAAVTHDPVTILEEGMTSILVASTLLGVPAAVLLAAALETIPSQEEINMQVKMTLLALAKVKAFLDTTEGYVETDERPKPSESRPELN